MIINDSKKGSSNQLELLRQKSINLSSDEVNKIFNDSYEVIAENLNNTNKNAIMPLTVDQTDNGIKIFQELAKSYYGNFNDEDLKASAEKSFLQFNKTVPDWATSRMLDYTTRAKLGILVNLTDETAEIIPTRSRTAFLSPEFIIFNWEDRDNVEMIFNLFSNEKNDDLVFDLFSKGKKDDLVFEYSRLLTMIKKMKLIQTLDPKSKVGELKELLYCSELHFRSSFSLSHLRTMYSITQKATNNKIYKSSFDDFSDSLTISLDALAFYSSEVNQLKSKDVSIFDILWLKREQKRLKEHGFLSMKSRFSTSVIKEGLGYVIS